MLILLILSSRLVLPRLRLETFSNDRESGRGKIRVLNSLIL
jgi:hypothetical protein